MSTPVEHGRKFSENPPPYQPQDEWFVDKFGDKIKRVYRDLYVGWKTRMPTIGTAHPQSTTAILASATARQLRKPGMGHLCDVTLNYEQSDVPDDGGGTQPVPETEYSESGSTIEIDIQQHPDWDNFKQYWDEDLGRFGESAPAWLRGQSKYIVGSSMLTVTTYHATEPSDVQGDLGKIIDPPGRGFSGHWLTISGGKNKRGPWWARTLNYQFSSEPIPESPNGFYSAG